MKEIISTKLKEAEFYSIVSEINDLSLNGEKLELKLDDFFLGLVTKQKDYFVSKFRTEQYFCYENMYYFLRQITNIFLELNLDPIYKTNLGITENIRYRHFIDLCLQRYFKALFDKKDIAEISCQYHLSMERSFDENFEYENVVDSEVFNFYTQIGFGKFKNINNQDESLRSLNTLFKYIDNRQKFTKFRDNEQVKQFYPSERINKILDELRSIDKSNLVDNIDLFDSEDEFFLKTPFLNDDVCIISLSSVITYRIIDCNLLSYLDNIHDTFDSGIKKKVSNNLPDVQKPNLNETVKENESILQVIKPTAQAQFYNNIEIYNLNIRRKRKDIIIAFRLMNDRGYYTHNLNPCELVELIYEVFKINISVPHLLKYSPCSYLDWLDDNRVDMPHF